VFPNVADMSPPKVIPNFIDISSVTNSINEQSGMMERKLNTNCVTGGHPSGLAMREKGNKGNRR
jgi:hypothetical protein